MIQRQLSFESALHSGDAIQRAAYNLSDRLSCDIASDGGAYRCTLHITTEVAAEADAATGDFRNEVLDQTLRERIRAETHDVRNVILALAFSNTGLVEPGDA